MALPLESIITRRCIFTGRTMGDIHRGVVVPFMLRRGYLVRTHDASTQQFPRKIIRDIEKGGKFSPQRWVGTCMM